MANVEPVFPRQVVSQAEAEAGTSEVTRLWTPARVAQAIAALAPSGGGGSIVYANTASSSAYQDGAFFTIPLTHTFDADSLAVGDVIRVRALLLAEGTASATLTAYVAVGAAQTAGENFTLTDGGRLAIDWEGTVAAIGGAASATIRWQYRYLWYDGALATTSAISGGGSEGMVFDTTAANAVGVGFNLAFDMSHSVTLHSISIEYHPAAA